MLQASLGGYTPIPTGIDVFYNAPNIYYEPSFNIMYPLQFNVIDSSNVYILFRIRTDNTDNNFEALDNNYQSRFNCIVIDATTGEDLNFSFSWNYFHSQWNSLSPSFQPYFMNIQVGNSKIIDCTIVDTLNNDVINFRTIIQREDTAFGYISIYNKYPEARPINSVYGESGVLLLDTNGLYVIVSPFDNMVETNGSDYDFSYPNNVVFYKMINNFVKEDFNFAITDYNPVSISGNVQIISVPNFHRVGVILIDGILQNILLLSKLTGYIDISATGQISGQVNTFRLYLTPDIGLSQNIGR